MVRVSYEQEKSVCNNFNVNVQGLQCRLDFMEQVVFIGPTKTVQYSPLQAK